MEEVVEEVEAGVGERRGVAAAEGDERKLGAQLVLLLRLPPEMVGFDFFKKSRWVLRIYGRDGLWLWTLDDRV